MEHLIETITQAEGDFTIPSGYDLVLEGGDIDMSAGATGTYDMILKDAVADALSIRRAATDMVVFDTSTPQITITPKVSLIGDLALAADIDLSASGTGTYDLILKDAVADALSIRRAATDMIVFDTSTPKITITPALTVTGLADFDSGLKVAAGEEISFYNTVDETTNYERLRIHWNSNVMDFDVEKGGSGTARALSIYAGGYFQFGAGDSASMYFDAGDLWIFRDRDGGDATRASMQTTNGHIRFGDTTAPDVNAEIVAGGAGIIGMVESATPTATANMGKVYTKNDNKLYFQDGDGTEHEVAYVP